MRKKKVWRYYCEHCKKAGCSAGHMNTHERGCTANPNRACRMCKMVEAEQKPLAELLAAFDGYVAPEPVRDPFGIIIDYPTGPNQEPYVKKLEAITGGCPACMLAAVRAFDKSKPKLAGAFDVEFKRRKDELWQRVNDAKDDREAYLAHHCM